MANKEFFRFLRGELNGYYFTNMNNALNLAVGSIKEFFAFWKNMQFDSTMPQEYVNGLGKFAGVYLPIVDVGFLFFIFMTESHVVNGVQRSERGLYNVVNEMFEFYHTEQDDYADDINTLATPMLKSSMVGTEPVLGYISEDATDVLLPDGTVNPEVILSEPPSNKAYTEYYGNQFLFLEEESTEVTADLEKELYQQLIASMQYIRYNHSNLKSLCKVVEILCPDGFVTIISIENNFSSHSVNVIYTADYSVPLSHKLHREALFKFIIKQKFPEVTLIGE